MDPALAMPTPAQPFVKKVAQHTVVWNVFKATTRNQLLRGQHKPCNFQLDAAMSVMLGKDMILITPTSSGKTLILTMPLLYHENKISIVISPLHALESDQVNRMNGMGIRSLLIDTVALPKSTFNVPIFFLPSPVAAETGSQPSLVPLDICPS